MALFLYRKGLKEAVLIGILFLVGVFLYLPQKAFAADWVNIGFTSSTIKTFVVDRYDKNRIIVNLSTSLNGQSTYKTVDGGLNWSPITTLNDICDTSIQNPKNKDEFWFGCMNGLYRSNDGGVTFARALTWGYGVYYLTVSQNGTLYYAYGNQIYKTTDGVLWQNLNLPNTSSHIAYISVNPNNGDEVYFSKTGTGAGLYRTTNGGVNWSLISTIWQFQRGINGLFFLGDGNICAIHNTTGESCSSDNGFSWSNFASPDPNLTGEVNRLYYAAQNPDVLSNLVLTNAGQNGSTPRIYSQTGIDKTKNTVSSLVGGAVIVRASQGVVFTISTSASFPKGLWRSDGIATQPEYLTRRPVIIVPGILGSWRWRDGGEYYLDPILNTYSGLIGGLKENGLEQGKDFFLYPYNWRQDNHMSALGLKNLINNIKIQTGASKVNIVAHSMGGLAVRDYAQSEQYENDIDKVIFLGTPHMGSPKAYQTWEFGKIGFGESLLANSIIDYLFTEEAKMNGYADILSYLRNRVPSVQQLLPIYDYLQINNSQEYLHYPNGYPQNTYLEDMYLNRHNLFSRGINIINIATDNMPTVAGYCILGDINNDILEACINPKIFGLGDGTVPYISASNNGDMHTDIVKNVEHSALASQITNKVLGYLGYPNGTKVVGDMYEKYLFVKAYSPVDFYVVSPSGKRVGYSKDGAYYNEILGAFYSGTEAEAEFVTIPNPEKGEYRIVTLGNGNGGYKIESSYIDDELNKESTSSYSGITFPGSEQTIITRLDIDNFTTENKIDDISAPTTAISGLTNANNLYNQPLNLKLLSTDDISGVKDIEYSRDNNIWNTYNGEDIRLSDEGNNHLYYRAIDYAGNREATRMYLARIDTMPPNVSIRADKDFYTRYDSLHLTCSYRDDNSGVGAAEFKLDGKIINCNDQQISLRGQSLGDHTLKYSVSDLAGNMTMGSLEYRTGSTIKSLYLDIIGLYGKSQINRALYLKYNCYISVYEISSRFGLKNIASRQLDNLLRALERDKYLNRISEKAYNQIKEDILWLRK